MLLSTTQKYLGIFKAEFDLCTSLTIQFFDQDKIC